MTRFEIIKQMPIETLANFNVKSFTFMCGYSTRTIFKTSDCTEFDIKEEAIQYEIKWLMEKKDYKSEIERLYKECEEREAYIQKQPASTMSDREYHTNAGYLTALSEVMAELKEILGLE